MKLIPLLLCENGKKINKFRNQSAACPQDWFYISIDVALTAHDMRVIEIIKSYLLEAFGLPEQVEDVKSIQQHLANERTFLAWVRTSIAMIGLGVLTAGLAFQSDSFAHIGHVLGGRVSWCLQAALPPAAKR
ncbi:YidH family protein [Paenibacillus yonginensis]|uniref:YidH family protein n=1 Tax=Paenibacillus yonginensis TaxID=1462996 RepID=UPI003AAA22A8